MGKPATIEELLRDLESGDWERVEEAVEGLGDLSREGELSNGQRERVTRSLLEVVAGGSWQVRRAVATAAKHLDDEMFGEVMEKLLDDPHSVVARRAQQTMARRTRAARSGLLSKEHERLLARWFSELEDKHGSRARGAAEKLAHRYAGLLMGELEHELKRPIAPLLLTIDRLEEAIRRRRGGLDHLAALREGIELLAKVISSARQLTQDIPLVFTAIDLRELLARIVSSGLDGQGRAPEVVLDVPEGLVVQGDRGRLTQAFSNVLKNAIEAYGDLDRHPRVAIAARPNDAGTRVIVTVEDQGRGMAEEFREEAFNLFVTRKPGGIGFGLPITRQIVESEHGGSIRLVSAKGEGTTVTIKLPVEQKRKR